jgi:hypothetical protein
MPLTFLENLLAASLNLPHGGRQPVERVIDPEAGGGDDVLSNVGAEQLEGDGFKMELVCATSDRRPVYGRGLLLRGRHGWQ